jgi:hypothetical protein
MTTVYKANVKLLINQIETHDYYRHLWNPIRNSFDLDLISDNDLCLKLNDFWAALPDTTHIRRAPFFKLCDLCEGT